jgi:hypothetical protein
MHERTGELGAQQRQRPAFVQRQRHEALWSPATPGLQLNARPILDGMSGGAIGAAGHPRSLARLEGAGRGRSAELVRSCPCGERRGHVIRLMSVDICLHQSPLPLPVFIPFFISHPLHQRKHCRSAVSQDHELRT